MRTILIVGCAALLGAMGVLAVQSLTGGPEGPPEESRAAPGDPAPGALEDEAGLAGTEATTERDSDLPSLVRGPRFNPGAAPIVDVVPRIPSAREEPSLPADASPSPAPAERVGSPAPASLKFEEERRIALATFDQGDRRLGAQLLKGIYAEGRDRPEVDLSAEVARLLVEEASFAQRAEYAGYLARHGRTAELFAEQLDRAQRLLARLDDQPEVAQSVWDELTVAYLLAVETAQRRKVLVALEPFLDRMIFAGRPTPLLRSHIVSSGESLARIARRFGTTVGGLKRLNKLTSDTIQPRQRLRVLEGAIRVVVDKSDFRLTVTVNGRLLFERPVGLGRDSGTPVGTFAIGVRQQNPTWWRPGEAPLPPGDPRNILGTRWLGFQDTDELAGFGIHGTADAQSVGTESSAGCVRLRNEDIELLYDFIPTGTEVEIRP